MKAPTKRCPECGGSMIYEARPNVVKREGRSRTVETTEWWCGACGEGVLDGAALIACEKAVLELGTES